MRKAFRFIGPRPDLHLMELAPGEPPPKGWQIVPNDGVVQEMHKYLRKLNAGRAALEAEKERGT